MMSKITIECVFDEEGAGNPFFRKIYNIILPIFDTKGSGC